MMTLEEYVNRVDDIDLGATFNAMRRNQRTREYPSYVMNSQMAQGFSNSIGYMGLLGGIVSQGCGISNEFLDRFYK